MMMKGKQMATVYRVSLMSSERGWGREYWTEDFKTLAEAKARIKAVNALNTSPTAPDYYEVAEEKVEAIEKTA
jgi:hypothetical protein